jgi:Bacterial pre-peptidase C-terminal domain
MTGSSKERDGMRISIRMAWLAVLLGAVPARAQGPQVNSLYPPGAQRGTTAAVTVRGLGLKAVDRILVSGAGVTAAPVAGETGDSERAITVALAADAEPGVREVRFVSPRGTSNAGYFWVGTWREIEEVEENDTPAHAQVLSRLPVTVNGRLGHDTDVDCFAFFAAAGDTLVMEAAAPSFRSPMDPLLELLDPSGRRIARVMERSGRDPRLVHRFEQAGRYTLVLHDATYRSGTNYAYRLTIGKLPLVTRVMPLGGRAGTRVALKVDGVNLGGMRELQVSLPQTPGRDRMTVVPETPNGPALPITLFAGEEPEIAEAEPNDTAATATRVPQLPIVINGAIDRPGDVDVYRVHAAGRQKLRFELFGDRLGARLDAALRVLNSAGRQLAADDDGAGIDPRLEYEFPVAGDYFLEVRSVDGQGGSDYFYRLRIGPGGPEFALVATPSNPNVGRGSAARVTVRATRWGGFDGPIAVRVEGLPPGVHASPGVIRSGRDTVQITLAAEMEAPLAVGDLRVVGEAQVDGKPLTRAATPMDSAPGDMSGRPPDRTAEFQLATVAEQPGIALRVEPERVTLKPGEKVKLVVRATRKEGGSDASGKLDLQLSEMPEGVSADVKPIESGKNEVEIEISAAANAPKVTENLILSARRGRSEVVAPAIVLTVGG